VRQRSMSGGESCPRDRKKPDEVVKITNQPVELGCTEIRVLCAAGQQRIMVAAQPMGTAGIVTPHRTRMQHRVGSGAETHRRWRDEPVPNIYDRVGKASTRDDCRRRTNRISLQSVGVVGCGRSRDVFGVEARIEVLGYRRMSCYLPLSRNVAGVSRGYSTADVRRRQTGVVPQCRRLAVTAP